jgi:hypothetical protein
MSNPTHNDDTARRTTSGMARCEDGRITIDFGYLDADNTLHRMVLDVTAYADVLVRDLAGAVVDLRADAEEAELNDGEVCGVVRKSWMEAEADGPACILARGHEGPHHGE